MYDWADSADCDDTEWMSEWLTGWSEVEWIHQKGKGPHGPQIELIL